MDVSFESPVNTKGAVSWSNQGHNSEMFRQIFEAATRVFSQQGYYATRIPDIAKEAGVAAGSIYTYFPSKQALCNQVYVYWRKRLLQRVTAEFPKRVDFRERYELLWDRVADFAREFPEAFSFLEVQYHAPYLDSGSIEIDRQLSSFVEALIFEGCEAGVLKKLPPLLLVGIVYGSLLEIFRQWRSGKSGFDPDITAAACKCLWQAISLRA